MKTKYSKSTQARSEVDERMRVNGVLRESVDDTQSFAGNPPRLD